ncbi:hypothetical protein DFA_02802 [Cavenderia fasciculata]|uniref:Uncharacterized protein n=1 Tax=Cavenderia fasciculata TaxID=261658 RepID=F4PIC5_CACFS|nr:uncharacterized protein DFA_02802 [Cavenderia fasciculata]EGG24559.1 hypothetical protein DFA_02802 [Cavenderia fasciculata]|eukprot:XP_004362410.1 hypothetical protein DFA_02802 [Cavenderia fasciculata]
MDTCQCRDDRARQSVLMSWVYTKMIEAKSVTDNPSRENKKVGSVSLLL